MHTAELSDGENARLYGKCNNPFGHGHDYILEVTWPVRSIREPDLLVSITRLDELVATVILQRFAHRNINLDVPQFRQLVPTTENIACVIANSAR